MRIGEKVHQLLKKTGKKQSELAQYIGTSTSTVNGWKEANRNPSSDVLLPICEFFQIDLYELYEIKRHSFSKEEEKLLSSFKNLSAINKHKIEGMIELKLLEQEQEDRQKDIPDTFVEEKVIPFESYIKEETSQSFNYQVPYRGQIAAGAPLHRFSDLFDEEPQLIPSDFPAQYAWRIAGQSMEPLIKDGDMIFTRFIEKNNLQDGDIVVVRTNDGYNCKRIYHFPKKKLVILKSENPDKEQYPDQEYYYGDGVDTIHQIEGKVIF